MQAGDLVEYGQILLGDEHAEYHTDAKMLLHLNQALRDISRRSRSLRKGIYYGVIEDQASYGLPADFLMAEPVGFLWSGEWIELKPAQFKTQARRIHGTSGNSSNVPLYYSVYQRSAEERALGTVTWIPDVGDADRNILFRTDVSIDNIRIGDKLINITDGSEGLVRDTMAGSLDNNTISFDFMVNGEDNTFAVDDEFRVVSQAYLAQTIDITPVPTETDDTGTESLYLYYAFEHRRITSEDITNKADDLEIDVEFETPTRHLMMALAKEDEFGAASQETQAKKLDYEREYINANTKVQRRIREFISTWKTRASARLDQVYDVTDSYDGHPFAGVVI